MPNRSHTSTQERTAPHVATFVSGDREAAVLRRQLIDQAASSGDSFLHIVDPKSRVEFLREIDEAGPAARRAAESGRLEVVTWQEVVFSKDGSFEVEALLQLVRTVTAPSPRFPDGRRIIDYMEWALEPVPGVDRITDYEARLDGVIAETPGSRGAMCVYNLDRFKSAVAASISGTRRPVSPVAIYQVIAVHQTLVYSGLRMRNPVAVQ